MKQLLYKEVKLAAHPTTWIFLALGSMLLIPSYPYYVIFFYTCLGVFFVFLAARENKDVLYTASLPVRKRDVVRARLWMVALIELSQLLLSIPFAVIGVRITPNPGGNQAGIEANVAFFGLVLILFALFNIIFLPVFYRTAQKIGKAMILGMTAVSVYIVVVEVAVQQIAPLKAWLDTSAPASQISQLPILAGGIVLYAFTLWLTYKISAANFEKVNL